MAKATQEKNEKPRVFIGSSVESIHIANFIHLALEYNSEPTVWNQGIFKPSNTSLDDLIENLENFDFAVFVFSPDDISKIRGNRYSIARDNVIFEMGLFIGRLGKKRVFYIIPRHKEKFHLPSDLIGVTPLDYDNHRSDENTQAALGSPCTKIIERINRLGRVNTLILKEKQIAKSSNTIFTSQEDAEFQYIFSKTQSPLYFQCRIYKREVIGEKINSLYIGYVKLKCSFIKALLINIHAGEKSFKMPVFDNVFFGALLDQINETIKTKLNNLGIIDCSLIIDSSTHHIIEETDMTPTLQILDLVEEKERISSIAKYSFDYTKKLFRFVSWVEFNEIAFNEPTVEFIEYVPKEK